MSDTLRNALARARHDRVHPERKFNAPDCFCVTVAGIDLATPAGRAIADVVAVAWRAQQVTPEQRRDWHVIRELDAALDRLEEVSAVSSAISETGGNPHAAATGYSASVEGGGDDRIRTGE